jgi:hypothetical protein
LRVLTCSFHNIKTAAPTDRGCMHVNASLNTTLSPFCESGQRPASHAHQCMLPRFAPPDKRSLMKSRLSPCSAAAPPKHLFIDTAEWYFAPHLQQRGFAVGIFGKHLNDGYTANNPACPPIGVERCVWKKAWPVFG